MWDFVKLAPDKLLAISKTLTGASFGFGLSKVLTPLAGTLALIYFPFYFTQLRTPKILFKLNDLYPHAYPLIQQPQGACERQHGRSVLDPHALS